MSLTSYRAAPPRDDHPVKSDDLPGTPAAATRGGRRRGLAGDGELFVIFGSFCLADLAAAYSSAPWGAVPWALRGFTAEFGMGSGGTPAPSGHQVGQAEDRQQNTEDRSEAGERGSMDRIHISASH